MNVIVVGAGVIGASCADALAATGHAVRMLDMRGAGRGASQASAGVLAPYIEGHDGDPLLDLCIDSLTLYDDFIARVRDTSGRPIEYARTGTMEVAVTEADAARLAALHHWLSMRGVAVEWLEGADAHYRDAAISPDVRAGLYIGAHGFVNVPQLVSALVQSAAVRGASLEVPAEVIRVEPSKSGVTVVVDGERRQCDAAVIAAGAWSSRVRVAGLPPIDVRPIRGQLLHLGWPDRAALPNQVVWAERCYTVPWTDRTLLVGATAEDVGFDERSTVAGVRDLLTAVGEILPAARDASLKEVRVGLRPAPAGPVPLIGPAPNSARVILATGHFRNGVMLAPLTAKKVVEHVGLVSH
jgi:glycine oxidase